MDEHLKQRVTFQPKLNCLTIRYYRWWL